jgi:hypothetical protein
MTWNILASARSTEYTGTTSGHTIDSTSAKLLVAEIMLGVSDGLLVDSRGNTGWIKLPQYALDNGRVQWAYCIAPSSVGAGHYLTERDAANTANTNAIIHIYAVTCTGTPVYTSGSVSGATDGTFSATSCQPGALTPVANGALLFAGAQLPTGSTSAHAINSGFTVALTNTESVSGYLMQATAAAVNPTISWTGSSRWATSMVCFTEAAGDTTAPTITGPGGATTGPGNPSGAGSINVVEGASAVFTFTADEAVTWDKNGGANAGLFAINSSTGVCTITPQAYDNVTPANNVRTVGIRATDGSSNATTQMLTVYIRRATDSWPTGDVTTAGWTATPAGSFAATLSEGVANDATYITSPNLSGTPEVIDMALPASLPAGSYVVKARANVTSGTGVLQVALLNNSGVQQGVSADQALSTVLTTYDVPITTTGAATRIRVAVHN